MKQEKDETRYEQRQQTEQRPRAVAIILRQHEGFFFFAPRFNLAWYKLQNPVQSAWHRTDRCQNHTWLFSGCNICLVSTWYSSISPAPWTHLWCRFDPFVFHVPPVPPLSGVCSFASSLFFYVCISPSDSSPTFPPPPPLSTPDSFLLFFRAHTLLTINPTCNTLPFFSAPRGCWSIGRDHELCLSISPYRRLRGGVSRLPEAAQQERAARGHKDVKGRLLGQTAALLPQRGRYPGAVRPLQHHPAGGSHHHR